MGWGGWGKGKDGKGGGWSPWQPMWLGRSWSHVDQIVTMSSDYDVRVYCLFACLM